MTIANGHIALSCFYFILFIYFILSPRVRSPSIISLAYSSLYFYSQKFSFYFEVVILGKFIAFYLNVGKDS